jgi:hypothetical protein
MDMAYSCRRPHLVEIFGGQLSLDAVPGRAREEDVGQSHIEHKVEKHQT